MRKAFDTILQSEVSAALVAQGDCFEQYRYECVCCGEEVYVAAPYSTKQVAHFRHRNGNNDVECENYLGQFGMLSADSRSRKSNRERVEFYFDYSTKTFSIGLRFSEGEIQGYEHHSVDFALMSNDSEKPFCVFKITSLNFMPEVPTMIPLSNFSFSYYLSHTCNGAKRKYDLFNQNTPTFFKILGNDKDFKAKLVRSVALYTDTRYFVAVPRQYTVCWMFDGIEISDTFYFDTMGRRFTGIVLKILKKTPQVDNLIRSWGYQLDASETLTILWPPGALRDDVSVINSDYAFLYTSFTLQAHGNINLQSKDIVQVSTGVTKVSVKTKTKVLQKNTEIVIDRGERYSALFDEISVSVSISDALTIPDNSIYFLFNSSGVTPLSKGQTVLFTLQSIVKRYICGYFIEKIIPHKPKALSGKQLLNDILTHYKRTEVYDSNFFDSLVLSETALEYIKDCEISSLINSVAKQRIVEGRI